MKTWHHGWTREKWLAYKRESAEIIKRLLNWAKIEAAIEAMMERED